MSGRPTWVYHAHREQHWRVLEVIEPENTTPSPGGLGRYVLMAYGPFAFYPGPRGRAVHHGYAPRRPVVDHAEHQRQPA